MVDNTDGVYNGNILEFKLNINDLNKVLFQAIKYLSKMRIKGEDVPASILLIDLNAQKAYQYKSEDYKNEIQKVYVGAASKETKGFSGGKPDKIYYYSDAKESSELKKQLKRKKTTEEAVMPIDIDENCIVGWAERYYREIPNATKGDFLGDDTGTAVSVTGEIRKPNHFNGKINPYTGKTNEKFKYLMDCLNDRLSKKDLGAFYTPIPYAKKAAELVEMAVQRALDAGKKDYIILDRCAGTGNLESALIGLKDSNGDDLISHCIVSTYEYYEYKVLNERIGDLVREIIPPTEADVVYANGKVSNADAMSEDFINNPIIKQYLDDEDCAVILFENPPYRDTSSSDKSAVGKAKESFIFYEMQKHLPEFNNSNVSTARDIANQFIWSGFEYYLKHENDSYILFSPIKYWKTLGIVNKKMQKGFLFNRKHFHATASSIACIYWSNSEDNSEKLELLAFDVVNDCLIHETNVLIKKARKTLNSYYDNEKYTNDIDTNVWTEYSGVEVAGRKTDSQPKYNKNILGYMRSDGFTIAPLTSHLVSQMTYNARGTYLRIHNYLNLLPVWATKLLPLDNWYEKDIYATTSDGGDTYTKDANFLKSCLIYTCLSNQNKCLSFDATDKRRYQNQLCFDNSNESDLPLALKDLHKFAKAKETKLDDDENKLLETWYKVLEEAKKTKGYNPQYHYGVYQITKELNTSHKEGTGKYQKIVYDYPSLNGYLDTLKIMLKEYYKTHITEKMFKYELIK